jgi:hypothetical protein
MLAGTAIALLFTVGLLYAWGSNGHKIINRKAPMHLPSTMFAFKADSLFYETHASDPDIRRDNNDTSMFAEGPRHFLDLDDYPDFLHLPRNMNTLIQTYGWERVKQNGTNPWATVWVMDSLTNQLARGDLSTARYTAADLGHYVADAHNPLHVTANYNGQLTDNYGIHSRYESNMVNSYLPSLTIAPDSARYVGNVIDFVFSYINQANAYVDSILLADTYAKGVSGWNGSGSAPTAYYTALWEKTGNLTKLQFQRASTDLASLWYTAWVNAQVTPVSGPGGGEAPAAFVLYQNYPNPFNPATTIRYSLFVTGYVRMTLYNVAGQSIAALIDGTMPAGDGSIQWNAGDAPSGIYFCRLTAGGVTTTQRMLLIR